MPSRQKHIETIVVSFIALLSLVAYFLAFRENPLLLGGSLLFFVVATIIFVRPTLGLAVLLVARPLVDSIGEYRISFGGTGINVAGALSLLAIGWSVWYLAKLRANLWKTELFRTMLLFVMLAFISLGNSWDRSASMAELVRMIGFFFLYLVARNTVRTWHDFRNVSAAFAASLIIPGIVGLAQVLTNTGLTFAESVNRAYGTFGHPNVLAFMCVLGISYFATAWPVLQFRPRSRGLLILFVGIVLFLTQTRGAWLGLVISLGMIGLIHFRRLFIGGLFLAMLLAVSLPTVNIITTSVFDLDLRKVPGAREIIARRAEKSSYQWRIDVWKEMRPRILERPVLGFGLGAFPAVRELQVFDFFQGVGAHNDYLRLVIELGLAGFGVYIVLILGIFVFLTRTYKRLKKTPLALPALGMLGFSAAFVFMSVFDNLLQSTAVMWAYMILLGSVLGLSPKMLRK